MFSFLPGESTCCALVLSCLALAAIAPARAVAQPGLPAVQIIDAKVEKGRLAWTETQTVPVRKVVEATVDVNGMNVVEKREVTVYESVTVARAFEPKQFKATDASGKAIDAEKLADPLKETAPVVLISGPIPEKHRALFKDRTVFVEVLPAAPPK